MRLLGGVATCSILALLNFASLSLGFLTSAPGLEATLSTGHFHPHSLPFPDFFVVEKRSLGFQDSPAVPGQSLGRAPRGKAALRELSWGAGGPRRRRRPRSLPGGTPALQLQLSPRLRRPPSSPAPPLPPAGALPRKLYASTRARLR